MTCRFAAAIHSAEIQIGTPMNINRYVKWWLKPPVFLLCLGPLASLCWKIYDVQVRGGNSLGGDPDRNSDEHQPLRQVVAQAAGVPALPRPAGEPLLENL